MKILTLLFILIISIVIAGCSVDKNPVSQNKNIENTAIENPSFCDIESDCAIRNTDCEGCGQKMTCLNKSIESCEYHNAEKGIQCELPPTPWVTECKCIESKCVDCRGDECKTLAPR